MNASMIWGLVKNYWNKGFNKKCVVTIKISVGTNILTHVGHIVFVCERERLVVAFHFWWKNDGKFIVHWTDIQAVSCITTAKWCSYLYLKICILGYVSVSEMKLKTGNIWFQLHTKVGFILHW